MTNRESAVQASVIKSPMVSATIARLVFFGGRYLSLLFVARLLGEGATGFLLAVAIVEFFRIVFDYGLENSVLARLHQKDSSAAQDFIRGKGCFRVLATLFGQLITSGVIALLCLKSEIPLMMPLVASLHFSFLMGFGYFQAHLQTGDSQGMAALIRPLGLALLIQSVFLLLAREAAIPVWWCVIFFEATALSVSLILAKRYAPKLDMEASTFPKTPACGAPAVLGRAFKSIAPLGSVALLGVAYARVDALAVSLVASGALLTQYLLYQRLASAPLMFFSTLASVNIAKLSGEHSGYARMEGSIAQYRRFAYLTAAASGIGLAGIGLWLAPFFQIRDVNLTVLGLQGLVLALQVANGFHAALLIAFHESAHLSEVARNNTALASVLMPLGAWQLGAIGIALALCMVEFFCAAQYARIFRLRTC